MAAISKQIQWLSVLIVCITLGACGGEDGASDSDLNDAQAFKSISAHAGVVEPCVRAEVESDLCPLSELPLIGMEHDEATVSDILDRVVVSHTWMGERFEAILHELPDEMLPLFNSVTAVVIDSDVRPAYYSPDTGAIYLDPAFLWLSLEEKRTVSTKEDYRAGFDDPLAFRQVQRYIIDGQLAYAYASLTDDSTRDLEDILLLMARLLLHQLAHANDFIPPNSYALLDPNLSVSKSAENFSDQWVSTLLNSEMSLESGTMHSLADVLYSGQTPTLYDLEIDAASVGDAFEPDGAGDGYSYTTQFEDLAMLFETTMMKFFFNADYELAFTNVPEDATRCDNYHIGWGVRNRIGDEAVSQRARFVAEELLPDIDFDDFFNSLEASTEISGDWCLTNDSASDSQKTNNLYVDPEMVSRLPYL